MTIWFEKKISFADGLATKPSISNPGRMFVVSWPIMDECYSKILLPGSIDDILADGETPVIEACVFRCSFVGRGTLRENTSCSPKPYVLALSWMSRTKSDMTFGRGMSISSSVSVLAWSSSPLETCHGYTSRCIMLRKVDPLQDYPRYQTIGVRIGLLHLRVGIWDLVWASFTWFRCSKAGLWLVCRRNASSVRVAIYWRGSDMVPGRLETPQGVAFQR